jgi:hypothetical protein
MAIATRRRFRTAKAPQSAKSNSRFRSPPSGELINAVLQYADLRDDLGGGRVMLRLIWDERDDCLFRVLDGAPPPLAVVERPAPSDDDRFVLTPAALDYIAKSQSSGRG